MAFIGRAKKNDWNNPNYYKKTDHILVNLACIANST